MSITKDSSLLELLKAGGRITLPSGYSLEGDASSGYIQLRVPAEDKVNGREDGLCCLSDDGLADALVFANNFDTDD